MFIKSLADHLRVRRETFYPKSDTEIPDGVLRMLADASPPFPPRDLAAALAAAGFEDYACTPLSRQGTFHAAYLCRSPHGRDLLLRVNRLSALYVDWQMQIEADTCCTLKAHGIEHAEIYSANCGREQVPFDFQVAEFLDGRSLADLDGEEESLTAALPSVARYLLRLHGIAGVGFGFASGRLGSAGEVVGLADSWSGYLFQRLEEHLRYLLSGEIITRGECDTITRLFRHAECHLRERPARLLHGDSGNHNIFLLADGRVAFIDWEDALVGDPLFELAHWATFHPSRRWPVLFRHYFSTNWEPDPLFWLYFLRIAISKTVLRARFAYRDVPGRPKASSRIQQALKALGEG